MIEMKIIYNGTVTSEADIETLKWKLEKQIKKEGEIRVIVEVSKEEKSDHYLGNMYWE